MKKDLEKCTLHISDSLINEDIVIHDFFKFSTTCQEMILSDLILPMLYDKKTIRISIGNL